MYQVDKNKLQLVHRQLDMIVCKARQDPMPDLGSEIETLGESWDDLLQEPRAQLVQAQRGAVMEQETAVGLTATEETPGKVPEGAAALPKVSDEAYVFAEAYKAAFAESQSPRRSEVAAYWAAAEFRRMKTA